MGKAAEGMKHSATQLHFESSTCSPVTVLLNSVSTTWQVSVVVVAVMLVVVVLVVEL
jgi:hypothetical protein